MWEEQSGTKMSEEDLRRIYRVRDEAIERAAELTNYACNEHNRAVKLQAEVDRLEEKVAVLLAEKAELREAIVKQALVLVKAR